MSDLHRSFRGPVIVGASEEPPFDDAEMRAIASRRAEADAIVAAPSPVTAAVEQLLPIVRSSSEPPANVVVRVREDEAGGAAVREIVVPTENADRITIEVS